MRLALIALSASLIILDQASAQQSKWQQHGYSLTGIGAGLAKLPARENATAAPWQGMFLRFSGAQLSFYTGDYTFKDEKGSKVVSHGYKADVGIHAPIAGLAMGHRAFGIRGMTLCPYVEGSTGFLGTGRSTGVAFTLAPGYALQLPFIGFQIQMNATYNYYQPFSEVDAMMGRLEIERKLTQGLLFYPSFGIYMDGLVELLPVSNIKGVGLTNTRMNDYLNSEESYTYRDNQGNLWYYHKPADPNILASGEWYNYEVNINTMKTFWGIAPLLGIMSPHYDKGLSLTYGADLLFRYRGLAFDFMYEKGHLGARAPQMPKSEDGNYKLHNYYDAEVMTASAGFDLLRLIIKSKFETEGRLKGRVMFERLLLGWRFGERSLKTVITDPLPATAPNTSLKYQDNTTYQLVDRGQSFVNYPYMAYEYGSVGLSVEYLPKTYFDYASGVKCNIYCNFPLAGVTKAWFRKYRSRDYGPEGGR